MKSPINVFIDTNIYLGLYHLSKDDIVELKKLLRYIEKNNLNLYLTDQVKDEYLRNREKIVKTALDELRESKLQLKYPNLCHRYNEYKKLNDLGRKYKKELKSLIEIIEADVEKKQLEADILIKSLFNKAKIIKLSREIFSYALQRVYIRNPPGKDGDYGDAINWESLIKEKLANRPFHFITDDNDYYSIFGIDKPKEFLLQEWKEKKNTTIYFYRNLSQFFSTHLKDVQLSDEKHKEELITSLAQSLTFNNTHDCISELRRYENFSSSQIDRMIQALFENSQINSIFSDADVHSFYHELLNQSNIGKEAAKALAKKIKKHTPIDDDDFPF